MSKLFPLASHQALLHAIGVPAEGNSLVLGLSNVSALISIASSFWPSFQGAAWLEICKSMSGELKRVSATSPDEAAVYYSNARDLPAPFKEIVDWPSARANTVQMGRLHALFGRALCVAASRQERVPSDFACGCHTLRNAIDRRGKRSPDWTLVSTTDLHDRSALASVLGQLARKSPARKFLRIAISVLESPVDSPTILDAPSISLADGTTPQLASFAGSVCDEKSVAADVRSTVSAIEPGRQGQPSEGENEGENEDEDDDDDEDNHVSSNVGRRLAAADFTSFGEKLGLHHRDQLLLDDLSLVTRRLMTHLHGDNIKLQCHAVLALVSLITGCTDCSALTLRFRHSDDIWLEIELGLAAWDFRAYRNFRGKEAVASDPEPIFVTFPIPLASWLRLHMGKHPESSDLGSLLRSVNQGTEVDLKHFRQYLRKCGDPAHPPHRARFARSLYTAYLEVTGSDMAAALMCASFAATAPAALYYYGPMYAHLRAYTAKVYERLGLGEPVALPAPTMRAGCKKVLEAELVQIGWRQLVNEINTARNATLSANTADGMLTKANLWMRLLCTAFVIHTGHRGTRLECLTYGALCIHPDVVLINDKDEPDRSQPRLVPTTDTVESILGGAVECHARVRQVLVRSGREPPRLEIDDPLFSQFSCGSLPELEQFPLKTSDIRPHMDSIFAAEVNFGRSLWVTHLDIDGCDRWLVRSLTGHTRDVTRTHGAHMNVPPLVAANRLKEAMHRTGALLFGDLKPAPSTNDWARPTVTVTGIVRPPATTAPRVGDPRTLLEPLSVETLIGWHAIEKVRHALLCGNTNATNEVVTLLSLICIDHVPDPSVCIESILNPESHFKVYGNCLGIVWRRPHFVHATWIPVQPTTAALASRLTKPVGSVTAATLVAVACAELRKLKTVNWPRVDAECWAAFIDSALAWRRLTMMPSLLAISGPEVPAPSLSPLSMIRLADSDITNEMRTASISNRQRGPTGSRADDLRHLTRCLNKYGDHNQRLGERRKRAIHCLAEITRSGISWTPFGAWIRRWIVDELERTRDNLQGRYEISSLSTYTSILLLACNGLTRIGDPTEWDDYEFLAWVTRIGDKARLPGKNRTTDKNAPFPERARHALSAFARGLARRHEPVPRSVQALIGESVDFGPTGSASSILIRDHDVAAAIEVMRSLYHDYPGDLAIALARAHLSTLVPLRSGELSSLDMNCVTFGGGLVVRRNGFYLHKTTSAIRVAPLDPARAAEARCRVEAVREYCGNAALLMRKDGSPDNCARDNQILADWCEALRLATGDSQARPHSLRASVLQECAWPGWQAAAKAMLDGSAGPHSCAQWVAEIERDWTSTSRSAAVAGHADLRAAFGSYLSAWPLVYAIAMRASLDLVRPSPTYLKRLGLEPATLRKARSRATLQNQLNAKGKSDFCDWDWIMRALPPRSMPGPTALGSKAPLPKQIQTPTGADTISPAPEVNEQVQMLYLVSRILGSSHGRSVEQLEIPLPVATRLESLLPQSDAIARATSRSRKGAEPRAQEADRRLAMSHLGCEIIDWGRRLATDDVKCLADMFERGDATTGRPVEALRRADLWDRLSDHLPLQLSLRARIGAQHVRPEEAGSIALLAPRVQLVRDPRIGGRPIVSLVLRNEDNRVLSARLTSVCRAALLSLLVFRRSTLGSEAHAF